MRLARLVVLRGVLGLWNICVSSALLSSCLQVDTGCENVLAMAATVVPDSLVGVVDEARRVPADSDLGLQNEGVCVVWVRPAVP